MHKSDDFGNKIRSDKHDYDLIVQGAENGGDVCRGLACLALAIIYLGDRLQDGLRNMGERGR